MSVQFYPREGSLGIYYLDVSSFNAQCIFEMLGIQGTGEEGTVGALNNIELLEAFNQMSLFLDESRWVLFGWNQEQMYRYVSKLNLIIGYCLGNKCNFCWS